MADKKATQQTDLKIVLTYLPKLPATQLEEVMKRCRALLATSGHVAVVDKQTADEKHDWLIDGIRTVLQERGLPHTIPLRIVRRMREYKEFTDAAQTVDPWLSELVEDMTRTERLKLSMIAAKALARLIMTYAPITMEKMLHHYHQVPVAIETSFPGYAREGWMRFIIRGP